MAKIFIRERTKTTKGKKKPRFAVVAIYGTDLRIEVKHIRKQEIEAIATDIGAEVIYLQTENCDHEDDDDEDDDEDDKEKDEDDEKDED